MKKIACLAAVALAASLGFGASLSKGTRELEVSGNIDRDSMAAGVSLGYFVIDNMVLGLGVGGSYNDMGNDIDVKTFTGGAYTQYHIDLDSPFVPFIGVEGGIIHAKVNAGKFGSNSETAALGEGQVGVKAFIADNVAIAVYGFFDISNKEVFTNKDEMEKKDFGMRVGMNTYF